MEPNYLTFMQYVRKWGVKSTNQLYLVASRRIPAPVEFYGVKMFPSDVPPTPAHAKAQAKQYAIITRYRNGETQTEIARSLGVSRQRVSQILAAAIQKHL